MRLKRHLNARKVFVGLYVLAFVTYLIIGLQPAEATKAAVSAELTIPEIGLVSDVTTLTLGTNGLETPSKIVGSYSQAENKTLLIGHSTTIFAGLEQIRLGVVVNYDGASYRVTAIDMIPKSDIEMNKILAAADKDTVVIMTCAGQLLGNGDATHRLIVTATR